MGSQAQQKPQGPWWAWLAGHLKGGMPSLLLVTLLSLGLGAGGSPCQLPCPCCSHRLNFWCAGQCQFCPAGWLWDAGQCYYFSSAKKTWEQSREDCCSRGAQLVTIQANTTLVSAPSLACLTPHGHWADIVSAHWLWPTGPKPSQASRQGADDAVPASLGAEPCQEEPVDAGWGLHVKHAG
uniref:C-type lectin domain-containing protein n=1 Tax=Athene cunicularia TaxID=194338 RepID=A0A663NBG5_ATHCN